MKTLLITLSFLFTAFLVMPTTANANPEKMVTVFLVLEDNGHRQYIGEVYTSLDDAQKISEMLGLTAKERPGNCGVVVYVLKSDKAQFAIDYFNEVSEVEQLEMTAQKEETLDMHMNADGTMIFDVLD